SSATDSFRWSSAGGATGWARCRSGRTRTTSRGRPRTPARARTCVPARPPARCVSGFAIFSRPGGTPSCVCATSRAAPSRRSRPGSASVASGSGRLPAWPPPAPASTSRSGPRAEQFQVETRAPIGRFAAAIISQSSTWNLELLMNAVGLLMRFLAVEGITGQEKNIAREIQAALKEAGVGPRNIKFDDANTRIPLPTQTGNLLAYLPGTKPAPRLLFMTHMDTVPLCAGAVPVRKGDRIVPKAATALGGDNRTGCAVLVHLAATLLQDKLPHPPLTLL